ncbi:BnaCnng65020D [Brassica napus]|uniref:BnaCnng65020D protein n=1 Tax=Brassica napus TaxID=3708 RepID=A0A078JW01_BRANA|nr:BnaCnng65020D [Brassica napus]
MEELDIVIVGGGIAGLATSLALHRFIIFSSFSKIHLLCMFSPVRLNRIRDVMIEKKIKQRESVGPASHGEVRGVIRNDMVRALAHALPVGTLRLGSQIVSVKLDEATSFPNVHLRNGQDIKAKVRLSTARYIICYCSMIG